MQHITRTSIARAPLSASWHEKDNSCCSLAINRFNEQYSVICLDYMWNLSFLSPNTLLERFKTLFSSLLIPISILSCRNSQTKQSRYCTFFNNQIVGIYIRYTEYMFLNSVHFNSIIKNYLKFLHLCSTEGRKSNTWGCVNNEKNIKILGWTIPLRTHWNK